jgi:hypothetical protein
LLLVYYNGLWPSLEQLRVLVHWCKRIALDHTCQWATQTIWYKSDRCKKRFQHGQHVVHNHQHK